MTMAPPPVARIRRVASWRISAWVASRVGFVMQAMAPAGAPALSAARRTTFTASRMQLAALGCGEKRIGLPAFRQIMAL